MSELLPMLAKAREFLGSDEKLAAWLEAKNPLLGDITPLRMVKAGLTHRLPSAFPVLASTPATSPTAADYEQAIADIKSLPYGYCTPDYIGGWLLARARNIAGQRAEGKTGGENQMRPTSEENS